MKQIFLKQTKGIKTEIQSGSKIFTFTSNGKKRIETDEEMVLINGKVRLPDGQELYAILSIDELSSGEHCTTFVWTPDGTLEDLHKTKTHINLNRTPNQIFPYQYRYTVPIHCHDHHVGPDGWSLKF